jgi:predicted helicase
LPRDAEELAAFTEAGRQLLELHLGFETVDPWPGMEHRFSPGFDVGNREHLRVEKMRHPKIMDESQGKKVDDRSRIVFNDWITIEGIPERAHEYVIGSRSAIAWVMDAHRVRVDQASLIVKDPNDWCDEVGDPRYILDLVGRVVAVAMRTLDIVDGLPPLKGI